MPGLAALLDPPLRLDPSAGDGGAVSRSASLGQISRRLLGDLGVRLSAARPSAVRSWPGAAVRLHAAGSCQSRPRARGDPAGRPRLAACRYHAGPARSQHGELN